MSERQDAFAGGATVAVKPAQISAHPAGLAEANTRLPRRGRTRNFATRQEVSIAVLSCEAGEAALGGGALDAASLARGLAVALEVLPPMQAVWRLAVVVAGFEATIDIPRGALDDGAFDRDQAVEVAWKRASLIAQRCTLPQAEG